MSRSKAIVIKQERVFDYRITSDGSDAGFGTSKDEVQFNKRWQFKLRFPVILKPGFKLAMGLEYFKEEYHFEGYPENDYPFYQSLDDKPLRSIGTTFYLVKPWLGNRYFMMRIGTKFNGDEGLGNLIDADKLRISMAPLIGWKKNPYTSCAVGLAYSYDFGRQRVYPILSYNHTFSNRFGLESIIPLEIKFRYTLSEKNLFYASSELNGTTYNIQLDDPCFPEGQDYYLRKSEVRFLINYEREIHDWLWFSIEAGFRSNMTFELVDGITRNANTVIDNDLNGAFLLNASIFVVPPRKFLN
jgi:hypothetical protein